MLDRPDMATPIARTRMASAAAPATARIVGFTRALLPSLVREAEEAGWEVDPLDLELLDELGPDPGRLEPALDLALDHAGLLEDEDVLHDDDVALHPLDLGDVHDSPG